MKKLKIIQLFTRLNLLRFLVFVFGILFGGVVSFCSADSWNILDYYPSANCTNNNYLIRDYSNNTGFILSVKDFPVIIDYVCTTADPGYSSWGERYYGYLSYSLDGENYILSSPFTSHGDSGWCASFGDDGLSLNVGDVLHYKFQSGYPTLCFSCCVYRPVKINGENLYGTYYIGNFLSTIVSYSDPTFIGLSSIYYRKTSPKFKINYGNTSYEYELNDNLFIHLKSPTIQNGNTFSYAGSTGINLFYNGTSQFYNKSNLYLESMYWFNNNIFTPICL